MNNEINNARYVLNLTKNYIYVDNDKDLNNGINITKNLIINGNGHTINGNNEARALNIFNSKIILKNINFINCNSPTNEDGGAIICENVTLTLENSTFLNNSAKRGGGIYYLSSNSTTINSKFINNSAENIGGAIYNLPFLHDNFQ